MKKQQLQIVKIGKKRYYQDPLLNKLRNVEDPSDTRKYRTREKLTEMLLRITSEPDEYEEEEE